MLWMVRYVLRRKQGDRVIGCVKSVALNRDSILQMLSSLVIHTHVAWREAPSSGCVDPEVMRNKIVEFDNSRRNELRLSDISDEYESPCDLLSMVKRHVIFSSPILT